MNSKNRIAILAKLPLFFSICISLLLSTKSPAQWSQRGPDIDGNAQGVESGFSVSMPDAYTVAIGSINADGIGVFAGLVRIYTWNGFNWVQKGKNINGEALADHSGYSISMPDVNTIAIGTPFNDGNGTEAGHVRIYFWNGSAWVQKGADIDGEAAGDHSGYSVSMPDSNTVAIGAPYNAGNGYRSGHVRIYSWSGSAWVQKGADIDGEAADDLSGGSVSMPDEKTIAIGASNNDGNGIDAGHARIYVWNGNDWVQRGGDIDGEAAGDRSGTAVSMPDAATVAVGAGRNDGSATDAGHVRIYTWNKNTWTWMQKGADIDGEAAYDYSPSSLSMPDANTIAIGANNNDGNGNLSGHVRIYAWNGSAWVQKGADIDGEGEGDQSGISVSMPDANTVAIGAPYNNENGLKPGHVRVFAMDAVGIVKKSFGDGFTLYPNPGNGHIFIDLGKQYQELNLRVKDMTGKEIAVFNFGTAQQVSFRIEGAAGMYFIDVSTRGGKTARLKVLKE